jgi:hypothetical protein
LQVVLPFLRCKRSMSFMDHYLLDHDLSPYLMFPKFITLNAAEKALLCGRVKLAAGVVAVARALGAVVHGSCFCVCMFVCTSVARSHAG